MAEYIAGAMMAHEFIVNFSDGPNRDLLFATLRGLRGMHSVRVARYRDSRSNAQNRYYHAAFVEPFREFMESQGDSITHEDAHEILKRLCNRQSYLDKRTGQYVEYGGSTADLDVNEFAEYLERCAKFLSEYCGYVVPPAILYRA